MDQKESFKFNFVMQCGGCSVRKECPIPEKVVDQHHCDYELDAYDKFMNSLEKHYYVNEAIKILAEKLISNMIIAMRIHRDLKFNGLTEMYQMQLKDGSIISGRKENILKAGLHLDEARIVRILKEMKLTPREQTPRQVEVNVKHMLERLINEPTIKDYKYELLPELVNPKSEERKKKKDEKPLSD